MMRLTGLLWLCAAVAPGAPSYCAFEVRVSKPDGAPFAKVEVAIVSRGVQIVTAETDANGLARLCDAPFHNVSIVVGFDICGSVLVRDVKATWPETRQVFVTYVKDICDHFIFADRCTALVRVQDAMGQPLAGARFEGRPAQAPGSALSDDFGRLFFTLKRGESLKGTVTKDGHEPARVSAQCNQTGAAEVEVRVALRKR